MVFSPAGSVEDNAREVLSSKSDLPFGRKPTSEKKLKNTSSVDTLKSSCAIDVFTTREEGLEKAFELPVSQKLQNGEIESITFEEIRELFTVLSKSDNALVPFAVLADLLQDLLECSTVETEALRQCIDLNVGGLISAKQFHSALNIVSIRTLLRQIQRDKLRRRDFASIDEDIHVERDFFVDRINWRVDRDDAFATLPMTCLYMLIFICLVIYHLQIWRRQELERGIESWIANQGKQYYGPYLDEHVYSVASFNAWLQDSGLPGIFGDVQNFSGVTEVRMGTSTLVGDVLLRQHYGKDYAERTKWLLHSEKGEASLAIPGQETNFLQAARATSAHILDRATKWVDESTNDLELVFCTYSNQAEMYALSQIRIPLDSYGYVKPRVKAKAVLTKGYPFRIVLVVDALYVLYTLQVIYSECKDMWEAMRLGFKEFLDYWTIYNALDWVAILFCFINMGLWIACLFVMESESLQSLLTDDKITREVMSLSINQLNQIHDDLRANCRIIFSLHVAAAVTIVLIVLKFFKGFQANPHLQTVTMTLKFVAVDVCHFFIVFITIFASFAVIGHVLFGSDIVKFKTLASSFDTGITVLLGEYDWYVELLNAPDALPSGMPRFFLIMWFVIYMFFVLLVMLNMLLAIILERYSEVAHHLKNRSDARTLIQQTGRFIRRQRETRGFIPLYKIRRSLENDAEPGHPAKIVTRQSLEEAFPGMSAKQSEWIMNFLQQELKDLASVPQSDAETLRGKRTERFVQSIAEEVQTICRGVTTCTDRLQRLERCMRDSSSIPVPMPTTPKRTLNTPKSTLLSTPTATPPWMEDIG